MWVYFCVFYSIPIYLSLQVYYQTILTTLNGLIFNRASTTHDSVKGKKINFSIVYSSPYSLLMCQVCIVWKIPIGVLIEVMLNWEINRRYTVTDFILGGSKVNADGYCSHEIKRCLLLARKAMTNPDSILKTETLLCQQRFI